MSRPAENPYAAPQTAPQPVEAGRPSMWANRLAAVGFLLAQLFPLAALVALLVLLAEDEFGVVRWRVHRLIRMVLFRMSVASLAAVVVSLVALAAPPRRLALYGLFVGAAGSCYWLLAMLGVVRK